MAVGHIHDQLLSFISYYAPNSGQVDFLCTMLSVLLPRAQGQVVLGGDSNILLDQILEKSNPNKAVLKNIPKDSNRVACLLHLYDLIDAWREANPSFRHYTHFSQVQNTYSCIDHILVHTSLLSYVNSVKFCLSPSRIILRSSYHYLIFGRSCVPLCSALMSLC